MKKGLFFTLTLLIGIALGWWLNEMNRFAKGVIEDAQSHKLHVGDSVIKPHKQVVVQEDFDHFFYQFMTEPEFQLSRVKFPLEFSSFKGGYPREDIDTIYITKDKWQHNSYYLNNESIPIIYDNYGMELRNTDERIFIWAGVENGMNVKSYFKRIDGKWYLIKEDDFST